MKKWIKKMWKKVAFRYFIYGIIATLVITFILIPSVTYLTKPTKKILIYESSAEYFHEQEVDELLSNLSNINKIQVAAGCSQLYFIINYDMSGDINENEKFFSGFNGDSLKENPSCTAYSTSFFSENGEIEDAEITAKLRDSDFEFEETDIGIDIKSYKSFNDRNGFKINIEKIAPKNDDMTLLSWRTNRFNNVSYDCSGGEKQKCRIIKNKIAVIVDKDAVLKAMEILKPVNVLDVILTKELKYYYLDPNTLAFIPDEKGYVYNYLDDGGTCPDNSTLPEDIKHVTINVDFASPPTIVED